MPQTSQVSIGQGLLALEAMKMEHLVVAPRDGIVRGVDVMQGQQVCLFVAVSSGSVSLSA